MSCSPFDLRDYFLKELTDPQQRQVEAHLQNCQACREEMDRLRLTEAALFALREEEIPQRIAFVSDPVFEPSSWRRWWAAFWGSSARLGFAAAVMLSVAIVASAWMRQTAGVTRAEVDQRIQAAVAASEARQDLKTTQLVKDVEQRFDQEHSSRLIAERDADIAEKQYYALMRSSGNYVLPGADRGGPR
ncbi:MAG TPA: zf-HC2 domain-containing protein [Bryobacteraceae bacterium]|nr:zf-HC2 domain-containing protein [Bryobacteraceae bacterium]